MIVQQTIDLRFKTEKDSMDVEFRLNQSETSYNRARYDSGFLDEAIYAFFADCFHQSVSHGNQFNYYGPTKYRRNELLKLRDCLDVTETELKTVNSLNLFNQLFEKHGRPSHLLKELDDQFNLEFEWDSVVQKLIEVCRELISWVSRGIREKRTLWVLGV